MNTPETDVFEDTFNGLKFQKFETLNGQGFVCLVDCMGDESAIVQAARVSYGEGTKTPSDDTTLIRYLMRHRHTTPLEMVELKFLVYVPMDCWRQWIRHRTASVNEYSTRYSEAIDEMAVTPEDKWRLQSGTNKQGSSGTLDHWPEGSSSRLKYSDSGQMGFEVLLDGKHFDEDWEDVLRVDGPRKLIQPGEFLSEREKQFQGEAIKLYNERLKLGVAREQARKDLPLSTFTKAYWKIDLHNLLHFLSLRMDSHAQAEIREYATAIGEGIVANLYPNVWQAFKDYRLDAMTLTGPEIRAIRELMDGMDMEQYRPQTEGWNKREAAEFMAKLERMGM